MSFFAVETTSAQAGGCPYVLYDDWNDGQYGSGRTTASNGCPYPAWQVLFNSVDASTGSLRLVKPSVGGTGTHVQTPSTAAYGTWEWDAALDTASVFNMVRFVSIDENNFYALAPDTEFDHVVFQAVANGVLKKELKFSVDPGVGAWHAYRVERDLNGDFRIYMNGSLILTTNEPSLTTNSYFQVRTQDWLNGDSRVDNVKVTALSPPPPPPTCPTVFSEDFNDGNLDGWTVTQGTWSAASGYAQAVATGTDHFITRSLSGTATAFVLNYDAALDASSCQAVHGFLHTSPDGSPSDLATSFQSSLDAGCSGQARGVYLKSPSYSNKSHADWAGDVAWHHFRVVYADGSVSLAVNGSEVLSGIGAPQTVDLAKFEIGGWNPGGSGVVGQKVDNIRVDACPAPSPTPPPPPPDGAYYPLDDGSGTVARDAWGRYDGVLKNGATVTASSRWGASAVSFDGVDDHMDVGPQVGNDLAKYTVEAWVNFPQGHSSSSANYETLLTKRVSWNNVGYHFSFCPSGGWPPGCNGNLRFTHWDGQSWVSSNNGAQVTAVAYQNSTFEANRWYHVAAAVDTANDTMKLYIDGREAPVKYYVGGTSSTEVPSPPDLRPWSSDFNATLGADVGPHVAGGVGNQFRGILDEVCISNTTKAFTPESVAAGPSSCAPAAPSPPPAPTGTLVATSAPTNASVYVDGAYLGQTPATPGTLNATLSEGTHAVKMTLLGFADCIKEVDVVADRANPVHCNFHVKVTPQISGSDLVLSWPAVSNAVYHVHKTKNRFGWDLANYTEVSGTSTAVAGAATESGTEYYLVRTVDTVLGELKSQLAFKAGRAFTYQPGKTNLHWISVPYGGSAFKKASDIAAALEPAGGNAKISMVAKWDPSTQSTVGYGYVPGIGWMGTDFGIYPGDGVYIYLSGNTPSFDWPLADAEQNTSRPFAYQAGKTNLHWISIPFAGKYEKASDLVVAFEPEGGNSKVSMVAKWDPSTQSTVGYGYVPGIGWMGTDFGIAPGDGVYIYLSGNSASFEWAPELALPE